MEKIINLVESIKNNPKIKYAKISVIEQELHMVLIYKDKNFYVQFLFNNTILNKIIKLNEAKIKEQLEFILDEISEKILEHTKIKNINTNYLRKKLKQFI